MARMSAGRWFTSSYQMRSSKRPEKPTSKIEQWVRYADLVLKLASIAALCVGGLWTAFHFWKAGADDWALNLKIEAEARHYDDKRALLSVQVLSTNPRDSQVSLAANKDAFFVEIRKIPDKLPNGHLPTPDTQADWRANLLPQDGYAFLPHAEMTDMAVFVLDADALVSIHAEVQSGNDSISVDRIVNVSDLLSSRPESRRDLR